MAGKYSVVLNGRKREVCASIPTDNGLDYHVGVRETAGVYDSIRNYNDGLVGCLRGTGLESTGDATFSNSPMEDVYHFVYVNGSGMNGSKKQSVSISLKSGEISLHFSPELSQRSDEAGLLANAFIILDKVVGYVEKKVQVV